MVSTFLAIGALGILTWLFAVIVLEPLERHEQEKLWRDWERDHPSSRKPFDGGTS